MAVLRQLLLLSFFSSFAVFAQTNSNTEWDRVVTSDGSAATARHESSARNKKWWLSIHVVNTCHMRRKLVALSLTLRQITGKITSNVNVLLRTIEILLRPLDNPTNA